ncbi:MAG: hypothetical protein VW349_10645, partial [Gammaproteobacteria bacterium]
MASLNTSGAKDHRCRLVFVTCGQSNIISNNWSYFSVLSIFSICQCLATGRSLTRPLALLGWLLVASTGVFATPSTPERIKILYTNDIESVLDPLPAFWRSDMQRIGGIAKLATLINQERAVDQPTVLFD